MEALPHDATEGARTLSQLDLLHHHQAPPAPEEAKSEEQPKRPRGRPKGSKASDLRALALGPAFSPLGLATSNLPHSPAAGCEAA
jgi:hypothetical protein